MTPLPATAREPASVAVWDRFVRLCHWSLATGFGANWLNEGGDPPHRWIGYVGLLIILYIALGMMWVGAHQVAQAV